MNANFFKHWTPEMAYYLGWIWADGSVSKDMNQLRLGASTSDEDVLIGFVRAIGSKHSISRTKKTKNKHRIANPFTSVSICGKDFVGVLVHKHKIVPRKSFLDCPFPYVPNSLAHDFVRGYFDGDGSLVCTKQGYHRISIIGNRRFVIGLRDLICAKTGLAKCRIKKSGGGRHTRCIEWSRKEQIRAFIRFIYPTDDCICLRRKKVLANQLLPCLNKHWDNYGIDRHNRAWRLRLNGGQHFGAFDTKQKAIAKRTSVVGSANFVL